jgi:glycopeptide antibiotics resistance protein
MGMWVEVGDTVVDIWLLCVIGLAVLFLVLLVIFWRRKHSLGYLFCLSIFSVYLLLAMDKVFFPIWISDSYADAMKQVPFTANLNLIPFYFGPYGTLESSLVTLLQNVALTIPFGFGMNFLAHIRARRVIWLALAVGLGIEGTALSTSTMC